MMNSFSTHCGTILKALSKRGRSLRNLVVFLLIWATQEAVTELFFLCPCYDVTPGNDIPHRRESYSVMWMFVPTVVLWLMSIILLESTWRCLIGCRNRPRPHPEQCCGCFWKTLGESSLAPLSWLFLVFIDGTFVECAMAYTSSNCLDTTSSTPTNLQDILDRNNYARWMSTMVGLSLALGLFIIYFLAVVCYQCCSPMSYYQSRYADRIVELEQEAMEDAAREENYPVFKARWKALFHTGTDNDWTDASALPYTAPLSKKAGFIHTQFHGMRFSSEKAFMEPVLPPYRSTRGVPGGDIVVIREDQRPTQSHVRNMDAPKKLPAISNQGLPTYQQSAHQQENKRKKPKARKVHVETADDSDSGETIDQIN